MRKILVGYDGSDPAKRALEFAVSLGAFAGGPEIHLAYVIQRPAWVLDPVPDGVMDSLGAAAKEELLDASRTVTKSLATAVSHIETGNPGERLLELADRIKPDIVILGTLRHPGSERLVGSVPSFFLRSRRYPLLIVP